MLKLYLRSDGVTPVEDLPVTGLEAGADSDALELLAVNESGAEMRNILLVMRTESLTAEGVALAQGIPPQDERWGRLRIVGVDATGEPGWSVPSTLWRPLGSYTGILVDRIPDGCALELDFKVRPPGTAAVPTTYRWYLLGIGDEYSQPIPGALGDVARGIITGKGTSIVRGLELTVSGPADDEVHLAAGLYELDGQLVGAIAQDLTLDQNDSAAAALASGEAYLAAITYDGAGVATVTKGTKAAVPTRPTPPAGELLRAWVTVGYGAAGSEIEAEDLEDLMPYGRYLCLAGDGLQAIIYSGQALTRTSWTYRGDTVPITLDASDVSYLWLLTNGQWDVTLDTLSPEDDAQLSWAVETDGSGVIAITDLRRYAGDQVVIRLRGDCVVGEIDSQLCEFDELVLEDVVARLSDNGGGSADGTILDVEIAGATAYTDYATEDQRPAFAFDAADLVARGGVHQLTRIRRGEVVSLVGIEYPDSDASPPDWAEVYLLCRRPR